MPQATSGEADLEVGSRGARFGQEIPEKARCTSPTSFWMIDHCSAVPENPRGY